MTTRRFALWLVVWLVGWALWLRCPHPHWVWGQMLLVLVAPWFMIRRKQSGRPKLKSAKAQIVVLCGLVVVLAVAVTVPSLFRWVWSKDPGVVLAGRIVGVLIAVFGVVVNARQIVPRGEQHAA